MHLIEPFDLWLAMYKPEEDERSPFYGVSYNEEYYEKKIYNYYIHPYWNEIESETLYVKVLYADYERSYVIIELLGEWNDLLYNDIMYLKRNMIDAMIQEGICKFILIGENLLNYFYDDDSYFEEWTDEIADQGGWISLVNLQTHVYQEFEASPGNHFLNIHDDNEPINWRNAAPIMLFNKVEALQIKRLK